MQGRPYSRPMVACQSLRVVCAANGNPGGNLTPRQDLKEMKQAHKASMDERMRAGEEVMADEKTATKSKAKEKLAEQKIGGRMQIRRFAEPESLKLLAVQLDSVKINDKDGNDGMGNSRSRANNSIRTKIVSGRNLPPEWLTQNSESFMDETIPPDPMQLRELEAAIARGTHQGDPCKEFGVFCDQQNPEWFAVKVNQPDTSSAKRVANLIEYAKKRHPMQKLPDGTTVPRQIQVLIPRKAVQAWSPRSGKMGTRQVTWKEGAIVFFQAIMDSTLAGYFQPWFLDAKDFWWKRMGATPRSYAMTEFVNGVRVRSHYHIPRPCPQHLIDDMQKWMEEEEIWDKQMVMENDFGVITNEGGKVAVEVHHQSKAGGQEKWRRVVEQSGGRSLAELNNERLMLKGVLNENVSQAEMHSKKIEELENADAGGWNVGMVNFKRNVHSRGRRRGQDKQEFSRRKFTQDMEEAERVYIPRAQNRSQNRTPDAEPFSPRFSSGTLSPSGASPGRVSPGNTGTPSPSGASPGRVSPGNTPSSSPGTLSPSGASPGRVSPGNTPSSSPSPGTLSPSGASPGRVSSATPPDEPTNQWWTSDQVLQDEEPLPRQNPENPRHEKATSRQGDANPLLREEQPVESSSGWFGGADAAPVGKADPNDDELYSDADLRAPGPRRPSIPSYRASRPDIKRFKEPNIKPFKEPDVKPFREPDLSERAQRRAAGISRSKPPQKQTGWFNGDFSLEDADEDAWLYGGRKQSSSRRSSRDDSNAAQNTFDPWQDYDQGNWFGGNNDSSGGLSGESSLDAQKGAPSSRTGSTDPTLKGPPTPPPQSKRKGDVSTPRSRRKLRGRLEEASNDDVDPWNDWNADRWKTPQSNTQSNSPSRLQSKQSTTASRSDTFNRGNNPSGVNPFGEDPWTSAAEPPAASSKAMPTTAATAGTFESSLGADRTKDIDGSEMTGTPIGKLSKTSTPEDLWAESNPAALDITGKTPPSTGSTSSPPRQPGTTPASDTLTTKTQQQPAKPSGAASVGNLEPNQVKLREMSSRTPSSEGSSMLDPDSPKAERKSARKGLDKRLAEVDDDHFGWTASQESGQAVETPGLVEGALVKVRGGRYQGSEGQIVSLRKNSARVKFVGGGRQAEIPKANCVPILDSDDTF